MGLRQRYTTFIIGVVIFFVVYTVIQYFFLEREINILENLIISLFWSAGMLAFETWRKKKKRSS